MGEAMFAKWDKYWRIGNTLLAIACVLDPRGKMNVVEFYYQKLFPDACHVLVSNITVCMAKLMDEYKELHSLALQSLAGPSSSRF